MPGTYKLPILEESHYYQFPPVSFGCGAMPAPFPILLYLPYRLPDSVNVVRLQALLTQLDASYFSGIAHAH